MDGERIDMAVLTKAPDDVDLARRWLFRGVSSTPQPDQSQLIME
ncbi:MULTISPECIES: hypothetical protein [unclassified Rhizobium]|nr:MULTISPECIES: hypothetical protein [unclassified Rhizobium]